MADHPLPVIVSMATLPSRIGNMRPTIESLLAGELVPDRILVVVTDYSAREKSGFVIPDFLQDAQFTKDLVEVVVSSRDWGPGTKSLGALEHIEEPCILVTVDDDVAYRPYFLSTIVNAQLAHRDCSFSYFTYRASGLTVGQGCDGFSYYSPNLNGVQAFVETNVVGTTLAYHDDLWISFYLFRQGITVKRLAAPERGSAVYTQTIEDDGLASISGDASRDRIVSEALPRLIRKGGLSTRRRAKLAAVRAHDWLFDLVPRTRNRLRIIAERRASNA